MNRKLSYEGKELHEMTQEELKNCCNLCYNHFDKLQFYIFSLKYCLT